MIFVNRFHQVCVSISDIVLNREPGATTESFISNARHAVGDGDGGQFGAFSESLIPYTRHAVGDVDGG